MSQTENYVSFCQKLLKEIPDITPAEMCHNMHVAFYDISTCTSALHQFFPAETAENISQILLQEFCHPLFGKNTYQNAMVQAGYPTAEVAAALSKSYPKDTNRYALRLDSGTERPYAEELFCYDFGTGDFTVEAWVQSAAGGTVIAKKGAPGGFGNGGFLLVIKPSGSIKFATDDGFGFYEINSSATRILDGCWHHLLATRKQDELSIYVDFKKTDASERTNRWKGLNVSNHLRLLIGATDQWQEEYNTYTGSIGEVRIWRTSITYPDAAAWEQTDWITPGLCGCWSFREKQGTDCSPQHHCLNISPGVSYVNWEIPKRTD